MISEREIEEFYAQWDGYGAPIVMMVLWYRDRLRAERAGIDQRIAIIDQFLACYVEFSVRRDERTE